MNNATESRTSEQSSLGASRGSESGWAIQNFDKLDELSDALRFRVRLLCADCETELNSTREFSKEELRSAWGHLVMSSGLVTKACPKGCRSTFSDLNINTRMIVEGRSQNDAR